MDRGLLAQQLRCERVAQGVEALVLAADKPDARQLAPAVDDAVQTAVPVERPGRPLVLQEHFPVLRIRPTEAQVVDQSLADLFGDRQMQRRGGLGLRDAEDRRSPIEIVECQRPEIDRAQAQAEASKSKA